ncbi:amidohydrolase [Desulfuribacillus alkaliarsenatis]|uniref:5-methylthioadenosine/S-adenosylhomocysteine deaminase n=1 Tax=Desulfuribacillus alkaliarsenatis TaxID=766136 RepID=A0A1E5FZI5_9FIRM|nr:amidohydrolase [Desulfuribacillus alkaliarsenatis]OEF95986.1 N-ethylammeline chlorohydrolase [Desulfuribacillus alkaliarsenatis]
MKTILINGLVLTMEADWKPAYLDIVINDQRIEKVEQLSDDERKQYINQGYQCVDMANKVVMPGFVNTHGHAAMTLLRSYADDLPLQQWLEDKIWPFEAKLTADDIYWGTKLAIIEMLETGTTCFTDMYFEMEQVAKAVEEMGIRACLSRGMIGVAPNRDIALSESEQFISQWNQAAEGRITCTLGPHAPYTCPPDYLKKVVELANKLDVPIQIHVSETEKEVNDCKEMYGASPVKHLENIGLFSRPTIAAHCVHLDDNDIDIMHKHNVTISHNPSSNLKLASGIAPLKKYIDKGLTVGIGTDGCSSNNNLDMLEELKLASLIHKGNTYDPTLIPARKALEMATIEGAKALFLDEVIGSIAPGKQADIIAFSLDKSLYYPSFDITSLLVYSANSRDISDVFIAGKQIMKNRRLEFNKQEIFQQVQDRAQNIAKEIAATK